LEKLEEEFKEFKLEMIEMFMTKDGVIENLLTNQRTFEEEVRASTQRFDDVDWDVVLALTPAIKEQD
jgi:hypothetical protein